MLSNTYATLKAQFMKKLSNTEAGLKKSVVYIKRAFINKNNVIPFYNIIH